MIVASLLRDLGTPLLSDRLTASLRSILCLRDRDLSTFLPGHSVAGLPGNLTFYLVLYSLTLLLGIILGHLSVFSLAILFVFSATGFLGNLGTFLPGNVLALLSRNILAFLSGNLLTHLSRLGIALLLGHYRGYWLLNISTFGNWYWTAHGLVDSSAFLFIFISSIWNLDGITILFRYIDTVLLRNLLAALSWLLPALLPWFIPALLSGLIPALLLTVNITALLLSNSGTLPLCDSSAFFLNSVSTGLLILGAALTVSHGCTFLLISVFSDRILDSVAALLWGIMALLLGNKITLSMLHILCLSFRGLLTHLFINSLAFIIIFGLAFLLIDSGAFLFIFCITLLLI